MKRLASALSIAALCLSALSSASLPSRGVSLLPDFAKPLVCAIACFDDCPPSRRCGTK